MKTKISNALLAMVLFAILIPTTALSREINWQPFDKGIAMAKEKKMNVLLYFHADWCSYCKKMDRTTFKESSIINYINDNFIAISIDSDKEEKIASSFGVRGLPDIWFLKSDGTKISSLPGYFEGKELIDILKFIKTNSYETMSYTDFKKNL